MRDDDTGGSRDAEPAQPETPYEPPRADEIASEGQAATAAWITTGRPDDA